MGVVRATGEIVTCCECENEGSYVCNGANQTCDTLCSSHGGFTDGSLWRRYPETPATGETTKDEASKVELIPPNLNIDIPGAGNLFGGGGIVKEGEFRYFYLPYIGEYVSALYNYVLGIVGILAVVVIIFAGGIWLTAGGSPERIKTAQEYIFGAVTGVVLAFGSYLILYTINPDLVRFDAMKVKVIENIPFMGGGMEADRDPSTYSPSPTSSSPLPGAVEACGAVGELLSRNEIIIREARDRANIGSGVIPRAETCLWCYEDEAPYRRSAEACTAGGSQNPVPVNPKLCQLITALHDAQQQGVFQEELRIGYIIGDHSRCTKKTFDERCAECVAQARAGTVNHIYKSDHWDGHGMDIVNTVPVLLVMQRYIVENLKDQLEIKDIFGPLGWSAIEARCSTPFASRPEVRLSSPYNCDEGNCNRPLSNKTLCGHTTHIHVGF